MHLLHEAMLDKQVASLIEKGKGHFFDKVPVLESLTIKMPGTKDLWEHSKSVCGSVRSNPVLRWAALFHDIGKPVVFETNRSDIGGTFPNHAMIGADIWLDNCRRFSRILTADQIKSVERLVRYHMQVLSYSPKWNDKALQRLVDRFEGDIELGIELAEADGGDLGVLYNLRQRIKRGGANEQ